MQVVLFVDLLFSKISEQNVEAIVEAIGKMQQQNAQRFKQNEQRITQMISTFKEEMAKERELFWDEFSKQRELLLNQPKKTG